MSYVSYLKVIDGIKQAKERNNAKKGINESIKG